VGRVKGLWTRGYLIKHVAFLGYQQYQLSLGPTLHLQNFFTWAMKPSMCWTITRNTVALVPIRPGLHGRQHSV